MRLSNLRYRPSQHCPVSEFARLPRWHLTVRRHDGGSSYTVQVTGGTTWNNLDPLTALAVLFDITSRDSAKRGIDDR